MASSSRVFSLMLVVKCSRLLVVRRRRRHRSARVPPTLTNVARSSASTVAVANSSSGTVTVYLLFEIERVVLAVAEVAAVQRAGRRQRRGVAGDRAVERGGAADIRLPGQLASSRG